MLFIIWNKIYVFSDMYILIQLLTKKMCAEEEFLSNIVLIFLILRNTNFEDFQQNELVF